MTTAVPRACGGVNGPAQPFESVPVQPDGGLVQGQHGRFAGQDRGQGEQPLLRGGQFGRVDGLGSRGKTDGGQRRPGPALGVGLADELPESERRFPQDGPFEKLVPGVLEEQAHRGRDSSDRHAGNAAPADPHVPLRRPQQTVEVAQERRLAGAVRPRHGDNLAGRTAKSTSRRTRTCEAVPRRRESWP